MRKPKIGLLGLMAGSYEPIFRGSSPGRRRLRASWPRPSRPLQTLISPAPPSTGRISSRKCAISTSRTATVCSSSF